MYLKNSDVSDMLVSYKDINMIPKFYKSTPLGIKPNVLDSLKGITYLFIYFFMKMNLLL